MAKPGSSRPAAPAGSGSGSSSRSRSRYVSGSSRSSSHFRSLRLAVSGDGPRRGRSPPPQSKRASPPPSFVTHEARMMQSLEEDRNLDDDAILQIHMMATKARITALEQRVDAAEARADAEEQRVNAIKEQLTKLVAILVSHFG